MDRLLNFFSPSPLTKPVSAPPPPKPNIISPLSNILLSLSVAPSSSSRDLGLGFHTKMLQPATYQNYQANPGGNDPTNTTILVDGFEENVSDDSLRQVFGQFGELVHVKIPAGKRYGFVQFADRACAEQVLLVVNGTQIGGTNVRLSWGHSPNKQAQSDQTQWNNGAYFGYGAQGYEAASGSYLSPSERNFLAKCIDEVEFKRIMASGDDDDYYDDNYDLSDLIGDDGVQNLDNMEARFPTIIHLIEGSGSYLSPSECDFLAECLDEEEFNSIMESGDYDDYYDYCDLSDPDEEAGEVLCTAMLCTPRPLDRVLDGSDVF